MAISVFLSTVSDEFRAYRDQLRGDLTRHNAAVKVQEDFKDFGGDTLDKLDVYIAFCDAVVHLVGEMCGAVADQRQQQALLAKHSDLQRKLPPLSEALKNGECLPYTQWEAWLALYNGKPLMIAKARPKAPRGPRFAPNKGSRATQAGHLKRLKAFHRYPFEFTNADNLAKQILASGILDLLAKDYARAHGSIARGSVAEGFVAEMAKRVAGDKALDLDGMMQAVRNAIEIYEKEIAGRPVGTNLDDIVSRALMSAKEQIDKGRSGLARATLNRAARELEREETERRERFVAGVTALRTHERNYALAAYEGDGAAEAIVELARSIHGANAAKIAEFLDSEADELHGIGERRGSNVHLVAAIALRRELVTLAVSAEERGAQQNALGNALRILGERESGTEKLKEAIAAFGAALQEYARERVPLEWAATQTNLGLALWKLGERERGTGKLEAAVAAYHAALEEQTRERAPLDWAQTQNSLANALRTLGERESRTDKLEQAVKAFREAQKERTRDQNPLDWAMTQNNLGAALMRLGERESGTEKLEQAVAAFRAALEERRRERVPLAWAMTQNNLGNALVTLGGRESGSARLEEAVEAYHAALEEQTRERVPLDWAMTQNNLGNALSMLGERESATVHLEGAIMALRAALEERTRERVPLAWAGTQSLLGDTLAALGERESGTACLEEAVAAYTEALKERTRERVPLDWAVSFGGQGVAMIFVADRTSDGTLAETATQQIEAACETLRDGGQEPWASHYEEQLPNARSIRDRLKGK
jgi:tetratricopeptide (TPR) repeat protein